MSARRFWFAVLVVGSALAAAAGVAFGAPLLLLPGVLLAIAYVLPVGNARLVLRTLASIGMSLIAAGAAAFCLVFVAWVSIGGGRLG